MEEFIADAEKVMNKIETQAKSMGYNINGIFNKEIFYKYKDIDERDIDDLSK